MLIAMIVTIDKIGRQTKEYINREVDQKLSHVYNGVMKTTENHILSTAATGDPGGHYVRPDKSDTAGEYCMSSPVE